MKGLGIIAQFLKVKLGAAPTDPEDAVRLQDLTSALSGGGGSSHPALTISPTPVTLSFTLSGTQQLTGEVRLASNSGLAAVSGGLSVSFGTGEHQAARGNHTHADLVTLTAFNAAVASLQSDLTTHAAGIATASVAGHMSAAQAASVAAALSNVGVTSNAQAEATPKVVWIGPRARLVPTANGCRLEIWKAGTGEWLVQSTWEEV